MRNNSAKQKTRAGFSLIELLVVIAIIGLLAGIVLQTAKFAQEKGLRSRAEAEIKALEAALESYKADFGDYPVGNDSKVLREALMPATGKVYFEFPKNMAPKDASPAEPSVPVLDPFGEPYNYKYPGDSARSGESYFDLWSTAKSTDEAQWIKNW